MFLAPDLLDFTSSSDHDHGSLARCEAIRSFLRTNGWRFSVSLDWVLGLKDRSRLVVACCILVLQCRRLCLLDLDVLMVSA